MSIEYYSQNGEDFLLSQYFSGNNGFFVEIGCIDGKRFSNTYHFERKGWKGICVEAHADYIPLMKTNRPNSIVVHCAVGEKDEDDVTFYANARGALSSLDPTTEERWRRDYAKYFSGFTEQRVQKRTLTSIFKQCAAPQIDILSIDIEGYEVEAMSGLDFSFYKPRVIAVESDSPDHREKLEKMLTGAGYHFATEWIGNLFYTVVPEFTAKVADKVFPNVNLLHTTHPLDKGPDTRHVITIDTRRSPIAGQ